MTPHYSTGAAAVWRTSDARAVGASGSTRTSLRHRRGIAKITINRPEVRNAFRPTTCSSSPPRSSGPATTRRRVIISRAGDQAFCSEATSAFGATPLRDPQGTPGSTCSTCRSRCGGSQADHRMVAATPSGRPRPPPVCDSPSPPTTPCSGRPPRSGPSTAATGRAPRPHGGDKRAREICTCAAVLGAGGLRDGHGQQGGPLPARGGDGGWAGRSCRSRRCHPHDEGRINAAADGCRQQQFAGDAPCSST